MDRRGCQSSKNGVVVGELLDAIDPSFDYLFLVGLDERKFSHTSSKHDSVMIEDTIHSSRLDAALKLKTIFIISLITMQSDIHLAM